MGLTNVLVVAAAALAGGIGAGQAQRVQEGRPEEPALLVVEGRAEVAARPDRAVVRLGATAQAAEAAEAQRQVGEAVSAAVAALRGLGVPERSVQTTGLWLHAVHDDRRGPRGEGDEGPRVVGYRASNVVEVRLDDVTRVGAVIDAGIGAGANELQGISFELRDDTPQRAEALRRAVQSARAKAEALADAAGLTLGRIHRIEEGGTSSDGPHFARMAMESAGTPVQPGEVRVSASVTVSYRLSAPRPRGGGEGDEDG